MVECWHPVWEVPGSKDVIKMVPVVPFFGTQH